MQRGNDTCTIRAPPFFFCSRRYTKELGMKGVFSSQILFQIFFEENREKKAADRGIVNKDVGRQLRDRKMRQEARSHAKAGCSI